MPKVAIISINYKYYADRFLAAYAESFRKVQFPEGEYKIFIVDNETSPETQKRIQELCPEAEIVPNEKNVGFGGGNNSGIYQAIKEGFEYFFIVNMDIEVEPDFISKAVAVYQADPQIGLLQTRLMLFDHKEKINSIGNLAHFLGFSYCKGYQETYTPRPAVEEITSPSGAGTVVSKAVFDKIGPFTEGFFMYHDDFEWGLKSRLAGFKNVVANEAVIYHKYEFSRSVSKYYWMERNRFILWLMTLKWRTLVLLFVPSLLEEIASLVFAAKGGWFKEKMRAYGWFLSLSHWRDVLQWRKETQARRTISDRVLMRDFVATIDYQEVAGQSALMRYLINPGMRATWAVIYFFVRW